MQRRCRDSLLLVIWREMRRWSARLFYDFCLDDHVPSDHILRSIDRHLDLDDVRQALKPFYSSTGRPSIDPELMIRMLIAGYCMGIRSERRLCEEVHLNLAYRWFCRLGLDDKVPDHSTFSKNRHGRFRESNVFRHLFETIVERCMAEGLVGADGFAVDASLIAADANKRRSVPSDEWKPEEVKDKACRAAREYLATLDDAAFGAASPVTPKFISRSDPAAQWTGAHKGHAFFAYATNYLIDTDHGVIVDVEATRHSPGPSRRGSHHARTDGGSLRLEAGLSYRRQRLRFGREPGVARQTLVKQKKITPHIPVFDKSTRTDGTFSRADFTFDPERDRYTCPAGKELVQFRPTSATPRTGITAEGPRLYRASKRDCDVGDLKSRCCPNAAARKIPRDLNENARDVARALASTPEYEAACRRRKKVEMLFAHLKRILRVGRLRLRGPCGSAVQSGCGAKRRSSPFIFGADASRGASRRVDGAFRL
jgi:transposase